MTRERDNAEAAVARTRSRVAIEPGDPVNRWLHRLAVEALRHLDAAPVFRHLSGDLFEVGTELGVRQLRILHEGAMPAWFALAGKDAKAALELVEHGDAGFPLRVRNRIGRFGVWLDDVAKCAPLAAEVKRLSVSTRGVVSAPRRHRVITR